MSEQRWIPRPPSVTAEPEADRMTYRRRWLGPQLVGCVVMVLFVAAWCFGVYTAETDGGGAPSLFARAAIAFWGAVGVLAVYTGIAHLLNTTTLRLDRDRLVVRHGPIPWPDSVEIRTAELRQLCCERVAHRSRGGTSYSYHLTALLGDGRRVKLLSHLASPDVPRYLEQRVERWLRIENQPVEGEFVP